MKKGFITVLFFCILFKGYTQTEAKHDSLKWRMGAFVNLSLINDWRLDSNSHMSFLTYIGGIKVDYWISRRFTIQTGIEYFRVKHEVESKYNYHGKIDYCFDVPLIVKIDLLKGDRYIKPYFTIGLDNQFIFRTYHYLNKVILYEKRYKWNYYDLGGILSAGTDIKYNHRLFINIEPSVKFNVFNKYGYRIGIETGVKYAF